MYVYQSYEQMITELRQYTEKQIDTLERQLKVVGPRTQQSNNIRGQLAAYRDLGWMMVNYSIREPQAPPQENNDDAVSSDT